MLDFRLDDNFVATYAERTPFWGFADAGGNSIGELAFVRSYSRRKPCDDHEVHGWDDKCRACHKLGKERWFEVCRRVVEGMFHEQRLWCEKNRIPWNLLEAERSAEEAYDLLFDRKWAPPGRGLAVMGTPFVHVLGNSAALQNCAFISTSEMTDENPAEPFTWLMEASLLGVGVGFDTRGAELGFRINEPQGEPELYVVPDTREGWCYSLKLLLESYLIEGRRPMAFDYSKVRPAGAPIRTFGGTAAGPDPLIMLHETLAQLWSGRVSSPLSSRDIVDIMNIAGKCVVSGNVRRSAEIAIGDYDDKDYLDLKNHNLPENAERTGKDGWAWTSNNSVFADVGMDYGPIMERVKVNGEPGLVWMDVTRNFGRTGDPADGKDYRAAGYNPCGEQPLESREMCTLVNLYPTNCDGIDDFKRAIKYAYLYAKTVTLIPTHWPQTNAIMQRNRRIGASFNGAWQFVEQHGWVVLDTWMDSGFKEIVHRDEQYSEWLCIRESIRHTTVKPDGTGGLLAGATPGAHSSPGSDYYLRRIRYGKDDPVIPLLKKAGYILEPAFGNETTTVVAAFPIAGPVGVRPQDRVNVYEKVSLAARMQRLWSDNSVSFTLTYLPESESQHLEHVVRMFEGQLKSISFLAIDPGSYPQMPYEAITRELYEAYQSKLVRIDWDVLYDNDVVQDAVVDKGCTNDVCEIPQR